jgi:hypothetical protein
LLQRQADHGSYSGNRASRQRSCMAPDVAPAVICPDCVGIHPNLTQRATTSYRQTENKRQAESRLIRHSARQRKSNPHFSPAFNCGGRYGHVYCGAPPQTPRRTVEYACVICDRRLVSMLVCSASLRNLMRRAG